MDADGTTVRMTVAQAAQGLGISAEAARQRVRRGTLPTEKSEDGSVFVLIDTNRDPERTRTDTDGTSDGTADKALLAAHLDHALDEIRFLREELVAWQEEARRKDTIIMSLSEGLKALEAPRDASPDARESRETATSTGDGVEEEMSPEEQPRSWWRRLFGAPQSRSI